MTTCFLVKYGPKINSIKLLIILLVVSLLVLFIYQVNAETSETYLIQEYQKKISEISNENKVLEINSAQIGSLDNVLASLGGLDFEQADKIHYIQVLDTQVVTK